MVGHRHACVKSGAADIAQKPGSTTQTQLINGVLHGGAFINNSTNSCSSCNNNNRNNGTSNGALGSDTHINAHIAVPQILSRSHNIAEPVAHAMEQSRAKLEERLLGQWCQTCRKNNGTTSRTNSTFPLVFKVVEQQCSGEGDRPEKYQ